MSTPPHSLHLAVALDGAGWHPAAWRAGAPAASCSAPGTGPTSSTRRRGPWSTSSPLKTDWRYSPSPGEPRRSGGPGARAPGCRPRRRAGRPPSTTRLGLVPVATVTHTEPFHVSKALATLDYVSSGRAGWQFRFTPGGREAGHFGRRLHGYASCSGHGPGEDGHRRPAGRGGRLRRGCPPPVGQLGDDAEIRDAQRAAL